MYSLHFETGKAAILFIDISKKVKNIICVAMYFMSCKGKT